MLMVEISSRINKNRFRQLLHFFASTMFDFSCASACNPPNPAANTVKVNMEDIAKRTAEEVEAKRKVEEEQRCKAEEAQKQEAARRAEKEAEERRQKEQEEVKRLAELEKAKEAAAAAAAAEEADAEKKRKDEEVAARKNETMAWLKKQGFAGVNKPKKSLFSGTTYPLHKAAETGDAKIVGGLLEQGANPAQKNSSGKTAQEVVMKKKKADSHKEVLELLETAGVRA